MTSLDKKIALFVLLASIVGLLTVAYFRFVTPRGERALIEVDNKPVQTIILTPDGEKRTLSIQGVRGESLVGVEGSGIHMIDSACPDKTCVHIGVISRPGELIVCLPNRVVIRVLGEGDLHK